MSNGKSGTASIRETSGPATGPRPSRWPIGLVLVSFLSGAGVAAILQPFDLDFPSASAVAPPGLREYTLEIRGADLEVGPGTVWHAWTFNGTVPGPLITATAGEILRVTVRNNHHLVHSFHTHLAPYTLSSDGSQLNTISGIAGMAMIEPGQSYTYEFRNLRPGVYYYHCHSAHGDHSIAQHIAQGLYGAISIRAPDEPRIREEALFMGEMGFDVTGANRPFYVMNGKGIPGGEHALEEIFAEKGIAGVAAELGKTVPVFSMKVDEPVRFTVVNIGDQIHSFHVHGMNLVSVDQYPSRIHPGNVVQLVPGGADRVVLTPANPGLWLFHCHVVSHADMGMIGVMNVEA